MGHLERIKTAYEKKIAFIATFNYLFTFFSTIFMKKKLIIMLKTVTVCNKLTYNSLRWILSLFCESVIPRDIIFLK